MRQTKNYVPPVVLKEIRFFEETEILAGSIVDLSSEIKAVGQPVETHDLSGFNHEWE